MNALVLELCVFTVAGRINRGQQQVIEYLPTATRAAVEEALRMSRLLNPGLAPMILRNHRALGPMSLQSRLAFSSELETSSVPAWPYM